MPTNPLYPISPKSKKTPRQAGFRRPAEWEAHEATWMSWPRNPKHWPGLLGAVRKCFARMIFEIAKGEKVHVICDSKEEKGIRNLLSSYEVNQEQIIFFYADTEDVWVRDYGPFFLTHPAGLQAYVRWRFNAWGNKYEDLKKDDQVTGQLASQIKGECFEPGIIMEGGAVDVDGRGCGMVTEQCLLNANRNPVLDKKGIEKYLKDYLGLQKIIWLNRGLEGDDTDGHIDDVARFVGSGRIVCAIEENKSDPNHAILQENLERLHSTKDINGKRFEVISLPMPQGIYDGKERRPASYANFYIANACVLVPEFDDPQDSKVVNLLSKLFLNRRVVGVSSRELILGGGSFHCVTQPQPRRKGD
jgi:agmatine deiminase